MGEVQGLEHALGQPGRLERLREALGAQRRLRRVLEKHRVAREQGRDQGVHRRQVGVVPGRDHEDHAERLAADEAVEARLGVGHARRPGPRRRWRSCGARAPRSRAPRPGAGRSGAPSAR